METFLARPSMFSSLLELDAEIFEDAWPTGEDRDVLEACLAAVAESQAPLTAANLRAARSLLTDRSVARASPSTSSAMNQKRLDELDDRFPEPARSACQVGQLLKSCRRM